jgi:hypothetical protein
MDGNTLISFLRNKKKEREREREKKAYEPVGAYVS